MMRTLARRIQSLIRRVHVALLSRPLPRRVALYIHQIDDNRWPAFRAMVNHFQEAGYRFVDPNAFPEAEDRVAFLSFDDNYRSCWKALPVLERLGVSATFYVNTCALRNRASRTEIDAYFDRLHFTCERLPLSVAELREIAAAGHVIGAHGHSHCMLAALPPAKARDDIATSKWLLEDLLDQEVAHFSYPYGMRRHFNEDLRAFCRDLGFRTIANAIPGMQFTPPTADRIQRSLWRLDAPLEVNLENLCIDGRLFERLTGRSPVG
jgi:peptidoglycan/xylan/chitin deacetylase (PgdA/CDA1 family)